MTETTRAPGRVPLSVLELAVVPEGATGADALRHAVDRAVDLDALGYHRVWFAEHHLAAGVASAAPAVLAAAVAARTSRIRVGSGAVLLSTTSPLVAAEQFGTVAALHPGRVDLALGRALTPPPAGAAPAGAGSTDAAPEGTAPSGADPAAAAPPARPRPAHDAPRVVDGLRVPAAPPLDLGDSALRQRLLAQQRVIGASRTPASFRAELELVLALREGAYRDETGRSYVSPPVEGADWQVWVLASSGGESARVAGELGLPLAANYHVSPATTLDTVAAYRAAFRPGVLAEPYVAVSADVLVAGTDAEAERLAEPHADWVLSIRRTAGGARTYPAQASVPWEQRPQDERALLADRVDTRFVGAPGTVVAGLGTLQRVTGADELVVTTSTHDPAAAARSFALLAGAWGLGAAAPDLALAAR